MRLILDSNIVIDFLARRGAFYAPARKLMIFGAAGEYEMWISASQMDDLFYVLSDGGKRSRSASCKELLRKLRRHVHIYSVGEPEVDAAIASTWDSLEDSLVHQTAVRMGADAIITRNKKDFALSSVPVMDAHEFFQWLEQTWGVTYDEVPF